MTFACRSPGRRLHGQNQGDDAHRLASADPFRARPRTQGFLTAPIVDPDRPAATRLGQPGRRSCRGWFVILPFNEMTTRTIGPPGLRDFTDLAKALGDAHRVRILLALRGRALCVCQLVELLDLAPSTVSKHLSVLRGARLVDFEKSGRWAFYRRADEGTARVGEALRWVDASLSRSDQAARDATRLKEILRIPAEELCRRQNVAR